MHRRTQTRSQTQRLIDHTQRDTHTDTRTHGHADTVTDACGRVYAHLCVRAGSHSGMHTPGDRKLTMAWRWMQALALAPTDDEVVDEVRCVDSVCRRCATAEVPAGPFGIVAVDLGAWLLLGGRLAMPPQ
jgi:hypothetical protein